MQTALLCGCGSADLVRAGFCAACERRDRLNREHFAGEREAVLQRDDHQCQVCGELNPSQVIVHHRRRGMNSRKYFITLCRACHVRIHHTARPGFGFVTMAPFMWLLWRELHPRQPEQRLLLAPTVQEAEQQPLFRA